MEDKTINLVVIDDSFDTEEKVVSTLRKEGYAARSSRVEDEEDLCEIIAKKEPDLVLYTKGMELISLKDTCDCLKQHMNGTPVPVIAVEKNGAQSSTVEAMRDGAVSIGEVYNVLNVISFRKKTYIQSRV